MNPDIFNQVSIQSGTSTTSTGSAFDTSRLARKAVFIHTLTNGSGTGAGSQLFVNIEASPDNSTWFIVDNIRYESGTSAQTDVYPYPEHFPYMRTSVIGSNIGAFDITTTITGRGV